MPLLKQKLITTSCDDNMKIIKHFHNLNFVHLLQLVTLIFTFTGQQNKLFDLINGNNNNKNEKITRVKIGKSSFFLLLLRHKSIDKNRLCHATYHNIKQQNE